MLYSKIILRISNAIGGNKINLIIIIQQILMTITNGFSHFNGVL